MKSKHKKNDLSMLMMVIVILVVIKKCDSWWLFGEDVVRFTNNTFNNANKTVNNNNKQKQHTKPSILFEELQLKSLCETEQLIKQFQPIRTRWTKCLGFRKIFLPTEQAYLKRSTIKVLNHFLDVSDQSLNPYCRLVIKQYLVMFNFFYN